MTTTAGASNTVPASQTIVVSGDVTVDWNLARESLTSDREGTAGARASRQRGGAALLADLLTSMVSRLELDSGPPRIRPAIAPSPPISPDDDRLNHSYAVWARFPRAADGKGGDDAWRVASDLGVARARSDEAVRAEWQRLDAELPSADVVVLDDAALGFRDHSDRGLWRRAFAEHRPWVVLKQARPVACGPLWEHLLAEASDRLIVVLTIGDLRGREVRVSRALSWERTAQDLYWELVNKPDVNALSQVAHTVVSFGPAGAAHLSASSGPDGGPDCTLHFDPELVEGVWGAEHAGRIMGATDCLTTALVREILLDPEAPRLGNGIGPGVAAGRRLHLEGYQEVPAGSRELGFPLSVVVEEMAVGQGPLQAVPVPEPIGADQSWTILQDRCTVDLAAKAAEIARCGPDRALEGVPLGRFAKLVTADRSEIEAFRSIAGLIAEYVNDPPSRPLSIGVFGPPGSGKSFGVKQVARSVAGDQVGEPLEFNLAQLRSPDELADAFHLVRDVALAGRIPLVFWDEFDTALEGQPLGWLRYFLAPMQDGEFRQGQLCHPIGSSIFVFAGGTCTRVDELGQDLVEGSGRGPDEGSAQDVSDKARRQAKVPDFVSRLKGFVNVLGPNPQGDDDRYHMIRRALLFRSILSRNASQLFEGDELRVDPGVLRAFLETTEFRHGARSLEAVVAMSQLSGKRVYERSSLPPAPQLDLHVDAQDFLALVQQPDLEGELLERLAEAAHHVYRAGIEAEGYTYGEVADPDQKISDSLVAYEDLPEYKKDENRGNVSDIPSKLAQVGCVMVPSATDPIPTDFTDSEIETLAREEHERWMRDLGPGWRHGEPTDKDGKIQAAYLPWDELPEEQKDKDRNLIRELPTVLRQAGYAMVRRRQPDREPS